MFFFSFSDIEEDLDYNYAAGILGAPIITPNDPDVTLEIGQNFTIECKNKDPILWHLPPVMHFIKLYFFCFVNFFFKNNLCFFFLFREQM